MRSESSEPVKHATPSLTRLVRYLSTLRLHADRPPDPRDSRGLMFTCRALQNMQRDAQTELNICFKRSYDEVLRHHHSFIIRSVVSVSVIYGLDRDSR